MIKFPRKLMSLALVGVAGFTAFQFAGPGQVAQASTTPSGQANPFRYLPKVPTLRVTSTDVRSGHPLPTAQQSGIFGVPGGKDISPQLSWSGFPSRAKSFVVSMFDPQAPAMGGVTHWAVADIPARTHSLPSNAGSADGRHLPVGAFQTNDIATRRYVGAAPKAGTGVHDYYITVTALDIPATGLDPQTTTPALLDLTIADHMLARGTIVAPTAAR
jgi:Raf kinase inhibitor-like YbhB/YbcL family protein